MLNKKEIRKYQNKINELGDWYQPIEFIGKKLRSKSRYGSRSTIQGINKWNFIIRKNLPKNLKGLKILDIGCASGLFSVSCAREGADVVGVELDREGYAQSILTREIYSKIDGVDYEKNFRILEEDFMNFDWEKYGKFDIVMALNVLYWVKIPYEKISIENRKKYDNSSLLDLIKKIKSNSRMVVIQADENKYRRRLQDRGPTEFTDSRSVAKFLEKCGFKNIKIDKPIALKSFLRTVILGTPEVDFKKPFYYSRPIIRAKS
jgi:SAM-dependent methyltransferase